MNINKNNLYFWFSVLFLIVSAGYALKNYLTVLETTHQLAQREDQLMVTYNEQLKLKNLISSLENIKKIVTFKDNYQLLFNTLDEILMPFMCELEATDYKNEFYDFVIKSGCTECKFMIEFASSFSCLGEYLDYLESQQLPVQFTKITVSPPANEFDGIQSKIMGKFLLPQ